MKRTVILCLRADSLSLAAFAARLNLLAALAYKKQA